jgi:hypothetical protein
LRLPLVLRLMLPVFLQLRQLLMCRRLLPLLRITIPPLLRFRL